MRHFYFKGSFIKFAALAAGFSLTIGSSAFAAAGPVACAAAKTPITPLGSQHLAALAKYDALAPANTGVIAVKSGAWSDSAVWGGKTPTGRVVIPAGINVVFDLPSSSVIKSLRIDGCLELSNSVSTRLNVETIYVAPSGELLAGTRAAPIPPAVTAQIVFADLGPLNVTVDPTLVGKGLIAASRVRLYGSLKTPRVKVATAPKAGDKVISLSQAPAGWRPGDRVILTGTRFIPQKTSGELVLSSPTEDEVRFIATISGSSVTLDAPLAFNHASPDPALGAYLVNYSRNIRMATQSDASLPVSQRAHSIYMSTETTIEGVEFFEMGRTDKSVRAVDVASLTTVTPTSNIKGRYPIHLHLSGFPSDSQAPVLRNIAVWGSPGWGVAQHNGKAFLYQNNTWNTFGAGFVSESGNETGAWVENTAIKAVGVNHIVKNGPDVIAYDLGRTGDGFWLQSRAVRLSRNLAVGMTGGIGFVLFHRNTDLGSTRPLSASFAASSLCMPASMRFAAQGIDKPNITQFTDNEVIASETGFHVVKSSPRAPHDIRSVIDNFNAWEVKHGVDITYTSRYTIKGGKLYGAQGASGNTGVRFGRNTYDLAVVGAKIQNFDYGLDLSKASTEVFATNYRYSAAGVQYAQIRISNLINQDATDQILASVPVASPATLAFAWGSGPALALNGPSLSIKGSKKDSSGVTPYPIVTDEFAFNRPSFFGIAAERGWYTVNATQTRALVVPEFYSDRLTGEIFQTSFIVTPTTSFQWPSTRTDGSPALQGVVSTQAAPPSAANDTATVSANSTVLIPALSNDSTNDGVLATAGYTPARNGNVSQRADGSFDYAPYPDFRGSDRFDYWVRNRQGAVARATVAITVR